MTSVLRGRGVMNFTLLGTNKTDDGLREMRVRTKGEGVQKSKNFADFMRKSMIPIFA